MRLPRNGFTSAAGMNAVNYNQLTSAVANVGADLTAATNQVLLDAHYYTQNYTDAATNYLTQLTTNLYDNVKVRAFKAVNQTIPKTRWVKVTYQDREYDSLGLFITNLSRFVPNQSGYYQLYATVRYEQSTQGAHELAVYKNGIPHAFASTVAAPGPSPLGVTVSDVIDLTTNDYVDVYTYQSSNGDTVILSPGQFLLLNLQAQLTLRIDCSFSCGTGLTPVLFLAPLW